MDPRYYGLIPDFLPREIPESEDKMQFAQCKCGERKMWDSGCAIQDCQGCEKCGTTLARGPSLHRDLIPHDPKPQYNQNTGELSHYVCRRCHYLCDKNGKGVETKTTD